MKTTFKKVFDEFDDELMNIEENDVFDLDIDMEKVKGKVFMRIKDNNKKKFGKKFTVLLVAAVILLVGTIGVFATGEIQDVFRGLFNTGSNMNSLGLYDGGDVTITSSDDSLDIKLLGVTGDGEKLYTAIEVTKKDGSAVVDENCVVADDMDFPEHFDVVCKTKDGVEARAAQILTYELSNDNKVMKFYLFSIVSEGDLQNGKMTFTNHFTRLCKIDYVFDSLEVPKGQSDEYLQQVKQLWFSEEYLEELRNERGVSEDECMYIVRDGRREYCEGSVEDFDIPFEITFDLNYETDSFVEKELSHEMAPKTVKDFAENVEMSVTPFGVYLYAQCDEENIDFSSKNHGYLFESINIKESKIVLDDGTVYHLYPYEGGADSVDEKGVYHETFTLNYSTVAAAPWSREINVIDTRQVKEVYTNGELVFSK